MALLILGVLRGEGRRGWFSWLSGWCCRNSGDRRWLGGARQVGFYGMFVTDAFPSS